MRNYTDVSFIVKEGFSFEDGLFNGYDAEKRTYPDKSWGYEIGEDGHAKVDPTLTRLGAACSTCSSSTTAATPRTW